MGQLIASIVLMYLVVGAAGYWGVRRRAELQRRAAHEQANDNHNHEQRSEV